MSIGSEPPGAWNHASVTFAEDKGYTLTQLSEIKKLVNVEPRGGVKSVFKNK